MSRLPVRVFPCAKVLSILQILDAICCLLPPAQRRTHQAMTNVTAADASPFSAPEWFQPLMF